MSLFILTSLALAGTVDHVPGDFATIQEAVDEGQSDTIRVAPGDWAGALVTRTVTIEAEPGARITSGPVNKRARIGFILEGAASGSEIAGFDFECGSKTLDLGVYASAERNAGSPDEIHITGNRFHACVQGVTNVGTPTDACESGVDGGQLWVVDNNVFEDISSRTDRGRPTGGIGVYLFNVGQNDVFGNTFTGTVEDRKEFTTSGILTAGCHDCVLAGNTFDVTQGRYYWSAITNFGSYQDGAAASRRVQLEENDASKDSAPHAGVNFRSFDSFDTRLSGNSGATYLDHAYCGDGKKVMPARTAKREVGR